MNWRCFFGWHTEPVLSYKWVKKGSPYPESYSTSHYYSSMAGNVKTNVTFAKDTVFIRGHCERCGLELLLTHTEVPE